MANDSAIGRLSSLGITGDNLIIAFDFAMDNLTGGASSFGGDCLHDVSKGFPNQYMFSAAIVGHAMSNLCGGKAGRPVFLGFGAADRDVFSLGTANEHLRYEMRAGLRRYKQIAPHVRLGASSSYVAPIEAAIEVAEKDGFHLLVIITCGRRNDMRATASALERASKHPLSIVFVGVGDGPWTFFRDFRMCLAENDRAESRMALTNTSFISFRDMSAMPRVRAKKDVLVSPGCLRELPDQYDDMARRGLITAHRAGCRCAQRRSHRILLPPIDVFWAEAAGRLVCREPVMEYGPYA
ncbi:hypothetical protein CBR_g31559 [Chara braunii]|uniref:Copine C-terminal domain-containing protein n=1 Tax=Chara braunii TaxID=69332 RepID=A0A388LFL0_CHABU|nr:hypothetical protein CBR_g31559 [Chara braunii]|eukprot:GBG81003.1 hypothetical protein CBR_g31559 [Chara braunii]